MMGSGKPASPDTNKMKKSKQKSTMSLDDKINMMLINTNADDIEQSSTSASTSAPDGGSDLPVELSQNVAKPKVKAKKAPITVISNRKNEKSLSSLNEKSQGAEAGATSMKISPNTHVRMPSSSTSHSPPVGLQREVGGMDNNRKGSSTYDSASDERYRKKKQHQRPRSTGHDDVEKNHVFGKHRQTRSEVPRSNEQSASEGLHVFAPTKRNTSPSAKFDPNGGGHAFPSPAAQVHSSSDTTSPSRSVALMNLRLKNEKNIKFVRAVLLCVSVEKSWMSRKIQRSFDQWIMYANQMRSRELADRITISRKQEEELHGASLRKITQEFVRVSKKISNFDRTEKNCEKIVL